MAASASSRHEVLGLGELAGGDAELPAEGVERLAAEDAEDDLGLAAARPTAAVGGMVLAIAFGVLCRGFFMMSRIASSSPKRVS